MNKMKNLLLVAICLFATSFVTSCLNSDGDSVDPRLTPEEESVYLTRISGTYTGKMKFRWRGRKKYVAQDSMIIDSIENMTWRFYRDSTVTIANFPDSIYNNAIIGNTDIRKILKQAPNRSTLSCYFAPYKGNTQSGTIDYAFQIIAKPEVNDNNPQYAYTQSKFTVDDMEYTAKYGYTTYGYDGFYSYQATGYLSKNGQIEFQLLVGNVQCSNATSYSTELYQVYFIGNKIY